MPIAGGCSGCSGTYRDAGTRFAPSPHGRATLLSSARDWPPTRAFSVISSQNWESVTPSFLIHRLSSADFFSSLAAIGGRVGVHSMPPNQMHETHCAAHACNGSSTSPVALIHFTVALKKKIKFCGLSFSRADAAACTAWDAFNVAAKSSRCIVDESGVTRAAPKFLPRGLVCLSSSQSAPSTRLSENDARPRS